jgi:hypothetical protein
VSRLTHGGNDPRGAAGQRRSLSDRGGIVTNGNLIFTVAASQQY